MASEPIIEEATVNFTKSFTTINATAAFYGILTNTLTNTDTNRLFLAD